MKVIIKRGTLCRGQLAQWKNTCFIIFFPSGWWFELRSMPGFFRAKIFISNNARLWILKIGRLGLAPSNQGTKEELLQHSH